MNEILSRRLLDKDLLLVSTDDESILDAAVCAEVNLCVLDALETIIGVVASPGCDHLLFVLPIVFREMVRD